MVSASSGMLYRYINIRGLYYRYFTEFLVFINPIYKEFNSTKNLSIIINFILQVLLVRVVACLGPIKEI